MHILTNNTANLIDYAKNVPVIVVFMFIGVVVAALLSLYHKHVLGSFVRYLIKSGANSPETAVVLETTKFNNNAFVKNALCGRTYDSVVKRIYPDDGEKDNAPKEKRKKDIKKDLPATAFYIPDDLVYRAENLFSKKGTTVLSAIVGIILFLLVIAATVMIVPGLSEAFFNFFTGA